MRYRNNLSNQTKNSYFEVVESFSVFIPTGNYESNVSVGSTKMLGTLYKEIALKPGDYLYDLFGGVFVTYQGKLHPAKIQVLDHHPLDKGSDIQEEYPVHNLKEITRPLTEFDYVISFPLIQPPTTFHGRGIDAIQI